MHHVLVVDDDRLIRSTLEGLLRTMGYHVETAANGLAGCTRLLAGGIDLCLLDMGLPEMDGMTVLRRLNEAAADGSYVDRALVIVVSARDDTQSTIDAIQLGAYDYLLKPFDLDRLRLTVTRAIEQRVAQRSLARLVAERNEVFSSDQLVGKSEVMRDVFKAIGAVAATRASVLLRGESGTGKEVVARSLHVASARDAEPFVAINCTAFARDLLESELFGHVKGAFTGAISDKMGRFQQAGEGTLFLDEIGEMPLDLQAKLLRVLQDRVFERVGDTRSQHLQARVVAATHRNLEQMVRDGTFREDLFYRLRVVEISIPPLRDRKDDIPLLVQYLLAKINRQLHTGVQAVAPATLQKLVAYPWPGNVRELENALTRACVLAKSQVLDDHHLPLLLPASSPGAIVSDDIGPSAESPGAESLCSLREVEKRYIARVLSATGWNKRRACAVLQITRPTLDRKIKEFELTRAGETS